MAQAASPKRSTTRLSRRCLPDSVLGAGGGSAALASKAEEKQPE